MLENQNVQPEAKVDQGLFDKYHEITSKLRAFYSYLTIASEQKKAVTDAWHNGESYDTRARLDQQEKDELVTARDDLKVMYDSLPTDEEPVTVLYRWKIAETIAQINMIIASSEGDIETFRTLNYAIYGAPDKDIYYASLDWIANDAENIVGDADASEDAKEAACTVLDELADNRGYRELLSPDSELFERIRDHHFSELGFYAVLLSGVQPVEGKVTEQNGDPIIEHVLKQGLGDTYHHKKKGKSAWGVSHLNSELNGPEAYSMSWQRFVGLPLGHEAGTHILEKINGEKSPLLLGSVGLDKYERGAEGRAVIREQVVYDSFDEFGQQLRWREILRRDIAIGYAEGLDGDAPRTAPDVYRFINMIDRMYAVREGGQERDLEQSLSVAQDTTDKLLLRVLKGGGTYLKDKSYLEGNVASWLVAAMRGESAISEADKAKYDTNNARHILNLIKLGVINEAV